MVECQKFRMYRTVWHYNGLLSGSLIALDQEVSRSFRSSGQLEKQPIEWDLVAP